eukprot:gnl/MRDRNA2_/MRDRNA2_19180_c0_seq1.p1 gnl/MRDRNA2_/MRDRNA2_19180_c0~~gnl/MRDRNA2_/MRDRNA2_19180_c0_seq1.p1  ORF type:complete len:240 (+),score=33.75 gnl/MRDRNA2_/MRDRNA2_19180_c0_seq1:52-771(+)
MLEEAEDFFAKTASPHQRTCTNIWGDAVDTSPGTYEDMPRTVTRSDFGKMGFLSSMDMSAPVGVHDSLAMRLSGWDAFARWIGEVCQAPHARLWPHADSLNRFYYQKLSDSVTCGEEVGQQLNWHFDRAHFSVTCMLQPAESGGEFQVVPQSRDWFATEVNDNTEAAASSENVTDFISKNFYGSKGHQGSIYLFGGYGSIHRVCPVQVGSRINLVLNYSMSGPDDKLDEDTRSVFFGQQ